MIILRFYVLYNGVIVVTVFGTHIQNSDIETKETVEELRPPQCLFLAWNTYGQTVNIML